MEFALLLEQAERGDVKAQLRVADLFETSIDIPYRPDEAVKWVQRAAEQGNVVAQVRLADLFETGFRVPQSYTEAFKWYRLAAEQGDEWAQYKLGDMIYQGRGAPRDFVRAFMWHFVVVTAETGAANVRAASARSNSETAFNLERLVRRVTPAQMAEAKELARLCWLQHFKQCGDASPRNEVTTASLAPDAATVRSVTDGLPTSSSNASASGRRIQLENEGGTYVVPVTLNGALTLKFVVDSGATDVVIPADVFLTLTRTGTISDDDLLEKRTYTLADGSTLPSQTFRIRSLRVGDVTVENVTGSVAPIRGPLLLGQSFLRRLKSWSLDNQRHVLIIE